MDSEKMKVLQSHVEACRVELAKVLNGSVVEVRLVSPVLKPTCWMVLKNGCYEYSIHLKPAAKRDKDVYWLLVALWESLFHDSKWRPHTHIPFDQVRSTPQFAAIREKFLDAVASVDKAALRQAIDQNKQEQNRQMLEFARGQFRQISKELLRRGASPEEVQAIINEVVVESVHQA